MHLTIAEHIAKFTGRKAKFRERKFLRYKRRKTVSETGHKQTEALETSSRTHIKP